MTHSNRKIVLIRHGEPLRPEGLQRCISSTDLPLTKDGEIEAYKTGEWLHDNGYDGITIYSSPLTRAFRTAEIIALKTSAKVIVDSELREISCGIWENLTFEEIKKLYPAEFEERGKNIATYIIPEGENFAQAGMRLEMAIRRYLDEEDGDLLIAAHAGVIQGLLYNIDSKQYANVKKIQQPYAGMTILSVSGDEADYTGKTTDYAIEKIGFKPYDVEWEYERTGIPKHIIKHMQATADFQDRLLDGLYSHGYSESDFNKELLRKAAELHDIKRLEPRHAIAGAKYIESMGYPKMADLIAEHHSPEQHDELCEADILFYADKRVKEDQIVSIEERFASSRGKCTTPEGLAIHNAIYQRAENIEKKLRKILGENFI